MMPDKQSPIPDEEIEAEARAMVRDMIQRSRWYPGLPEEERNRRIEEDVELNWPLMLADARKRLEQRKKR
ncbi:hypothetical protein [Microvirga aerophila]|uniref:Antitoxin n=1 Tax=Microvirga aerophila TaxID=670291 RepID=A0A512C5I9_9HYPH|nr:hypothetical protein [Microvirga aerophila]GEO19327.1 hypothetical protein MAE02_70230 [Microvirga aerophila]